MLYSYLRPEERERPLASLQAALLEKAFDSIIANGHRGVSADDFMYLLKSNAKGFETDMPFSLENGAELRNLAMETL